MSEQSYKVSPAGIKNSRRTLDLYEVYARVKRPLNLTELSRLLEAPMSSCHDLVRTLESGGYLYELRGKAFYPTRRMLHNVAAIADNDPVLSALHPELESLRDRTGESIILGQQVDRQAMILDVCESHHSVRYTAPAGAIRELHSSSIGKALLGAMTEAELQAILPPEPFPSLTEKTITTYSQLAKELEVSRQRGWYSSFGESVPELHAISANLIFAGCTFAISVAGPITRFVERLDSHIHELSETIRRIQTMNNVSETEA